MGSVIFFDMLITDTVDRKNIKDNECKYVLHLLYKSMLCPINMYMSTIFMLLKNNIIKIQNVRII